MAYDPTTTVTDDVTDNLAQYHNELVTAITHVMSAAAYSGYVYAASMTGNVTLTDADLPVQSFSPTAARDLTLPAVASTNHGYYVINRSGTYTITIKNASSTIIYSLTPETNIFLISDGANNWYAIGGGGGAGGWIGVTDTWTYASANTINVPSGAASIYKKGMGIQFTQSSTVKTMYITVVADTLLTVTAGTAYTVANSAITAIAYTPTPKTAIGFPVTFACAAPTWDTSYIDNGTGGQQPTAGSQYFSVDGNYIDLYIQLGTSGVVKNTTGAKLTISAIPGTLPSIADGIVSHMGSAFIATVNNFGIAISDSSTAISIYAPSNITDNASLAYSSFRLRWKF